MTDSLENIYYKKYLKYKAKYLDLVERMRGGVGEKCSQPNSLSGCNQNEYCGDNGTCKKKRGYGTSCTQGREFKCQSNYCHEHRGKYICSAPPRKTK